MGLAFGQGCVFKRFKNCNGFLDVGKEFGVSRSTMNFKMNLMKLLEQFPRLKIFSLPLHFCHVEYVFQSESTLYSCLNVKKLLARSKQAWYLKFKWLQQDRTHNHLVRVWIHLETPTVNDNLQQMHRTDKYSQHNSTIWPVWLNFECSFTK